MIKHTIEISREPAHLSVARRQLVIDRNGQRISQIPCEDIGLLIVDNARTTYTHSALNQIAQSDAVLVVCGDNHLPSAMLLPLSQHSQIVWRLQSQIESTLPLRKSLWKQVVVEKVSNQASNLPESYPAHRKLVDLSKRVKSGDTTNIEAQAAKIYWQNWLWQEEFRRDSDGDGLNAFLNYGYAIIRAALARAIVAAGLSPTLGLHHCNRSNYFCLADDLMEPLRPFVDDIVREMYRQGFETLDQHAKKTLLEILTMKMEIAEESGPLMAMLHRYVASLTHCFDKKSQKLSFPRPCS
jgi:CRISPR-associated protein Cas1